MPTYEYVCPAGHEFEKFQKMSDSPRVKCPVCGKIASRKISGGAGLVFKGSGFYITDYGKDGKGPRKEPAESGGKSDVPAEAKPAAEKSGGGSGAKSDAKSDAKSEPKPSKPAKKAAE
jgi:putative FmdB family regulatory protein